MPDTGPKARSIPAWGNAPCHRHKQTMSANGAAHPFGIVRDGMMDGAWRWDGTDFQPLGCLRSDTWGVAPGWYGDAPLALRFRANPPASARAKGPAHTSLGQRPRFMAG